MQRVRLKAMSTAGRGRDGEFLIAVIEILLSEIEALQFQHLSANCRGTPVCADRNVWLDDSLASSLFVAQPHGASVQIEPHASFAEPYGHAMRFGRLHQSGVQVCARDGIDDFDFVFAVRLKREVAGDRMHMAASHRTAIAPLEIPEPGLGWAINAARRTRKIEETPALSAP